MTVLHPGGCLCGKLRFEARGEPEWVTHCHCFFCRRQTGAAIATFARFRLPDRFAWTRGTPAVYASSPHVRRKFCRRCGTPLTFEAEDRPDEVHVGISAFDEPDRLPARAHVYVAHKISWFETADSLPRFPGRRFSAAVPE